MLHRFLLGLLVALVSNFTFAQSCAPDTQPEWGYQSSSGTGVWFPSLSSACAAYASSLSGPFPAFGPGWSRSVSMVSVTPSTTCNYRASYIGPDGTGGSSSDSSINMLTRCGPIPQPEPRTCPKANGEQFSFNRTEGWSTSPNAGAPINFGATPSGSTYDTGECVVDISGGLQSDACYRSQVPASNGMYRVSCDYTGTVTGDTSGTSSDDAASPNAPPPACPGTMGEVNGVPTCVPSDTSSTTPAPDKGANTNGTGNPPAGGLPDGQGTSDGGEARTPSTGNGDAAGGPSGAFNPNGAPGDTDSDGTDEQGEPCGAPGQPVCRVKVDETGTKSTGDYSKADTALESGKNAITGAIEDATQRTGLGVSVFSFAFPSGTCTPVTFGAYKIWNVTLDMCSFPKVDLLRELWAWFVGVLGALYIWRTARDAIAQGF